MAAESKGISLDRVLWKQLQKRAANEGRSLSNMIARLLILGLAKTEK